MAESSVKPRQRRRSSMHHPVKSVVDESSSILNKEQLQCPICLDVFTDPVTTPCGHNYCKSCLTQIWNRSQCCYCPLCKEKFTLRPELKINITLREVATHLKTRSSEPPESLEVLCDVCPDVKQKAAKSCLDCGVTFCASHLQPHIDVPQYKKHKLINALKNLEKYICQKHERPLDMFCRDDQMYLCQFCTEEKHKDHTVNLIEVENAHSRLALQQMIQERLKKIQEINHLVELRRGNTQKEKPDSGKIFTALICSIERIHAELLEVMEKKQKAAEMQAEGLVNELEQEIKELKKINFELELLSHTDENNLQIYSSPHTASHTKKWNEISIATELNLDSVMTALSQIQETLNQKLRETVSKELTRIQQYAVDVTLDPDTGHPHLILSQDGKQLRFTNIEQNLPDNPKRFIRYTMVLGKQDFSSGRFYYEVQVSEKLNWRLGVVRESVNRKEEISNMKPQDGIWSLALRGGCEYEARDDPYVSFPLKEKPQKVGVYVDYEEGLISFYDVEARSHIYSFTQQSFTEKLYPYFNPCSDFDRQHIVPLIISRV